MISVARPSPTSSPLPLALFLLAFFALVVAAATGRAVAIAAAAACVGGAAMTLVPSRTIQWRHLLTVLLIVILFVPIRRYTFPGSLPFEVEPYRIVVAMILVAWAIALLIDPRVTAKRSFVDGPVALIAFAIIGSLAMNSGRVGTLQVDVLKSLTFFASFFLLFYLVVSTVRTPRQVDYLLKVLLGGGVVVAVLAIVEYRTGYNAYDKALARVPLLEFGGTPELLRTETVRRAYGSAEHPIALGALLTMLIPLAIYAAKTTGRKIWWGVLLVITFGVLATVSRTSIIMLVVAGAVILRLRPREVKRLVPLALAVFVLAQVAVPGSLGTLKYFFFPAEGLVAQQTSSEGSCSSAGRIADLGPSLREYAQKPVLGYGFGTRIPTGPRTNACILDNQWLGSLLETGTVGLVGWLWLFGRYGRRLARQARRDASAHAWLATALAASVASYAAGMLTFDAFSFIQVTFVMFILVGFGAIVAAGAREPRALSVAGREPI